MIRTIGPGKMSRVKMKKAMDDMLAELDQSMRLAPIHITTEDSQPEGVQFDQINEVKRE